MEYKCNKKTGNRYQRYKKSYTQYREKNKDEINKYRRGRYNKYKVAKTEWINKNKQRWLTPKRNNNWKRRGLGFFQLNSWFIGSVGHHINQDMIIFIPEKLHKSISHNLETGRNMGIINELAFKFLEKK
jgi:hypothetical protein